MSLAAALDALSESVLAARLGAFRAAGSLAGAVTAIGAMQTVRTEETVAMNRVDRAAAATILAAFTRHDQSVGMNAVDRAASDIYRRIFTATPGLNLPGYGFETRRDTQFYRDLFTVATLARRRD